MIYYLLSFTSYSFSSLPTGLSSCTAMNGHQKRDFFPIIEELVHANAKLFNKITSKQTKESLLCLLPDSISQLRTANRHQELLLNIPKLENAIYDLSTQVKAVCSAEAKSESKGVKESLREITTKVNGLTSTTKPADVPPPDNDEHRKESVVILNVPEVTDFKYPSDRLLKKKLKCRKSSEYCEVRGCCHH